MLITRYKAKRNKNGFTLVELIVAIAVTTILAVALSTMIAPVIGAYHRSKIRTTLVDVSSRIMQALTVELCDATELRLTTNAASLPASSNGTDLKGIARLADSKLPEVYYNRLGCRTGYDSKGNAQLGGIISEGLYENAIVYKTTKSKYDADCFYMVPVYNYNDTNYVNSTEKTKKATLTCLELHLTVRLQKVEYSVKKTITLENLVISGERMQLANLSGPAVAGTKYYSVWYKYER